MRWLEPFVQPEGYRTLTSRLLALLPGRAVRWMVLLAVLLPLAHHLVVEWMAAVATAAGGDYGYWFVSPWDHVITAYLILVCFWGADHVAARLDAVLQPGLADGVPPRRLWLTWLLPPLAADLVLLAANESLQFFTPGSDFVLVGPGLHLAYAVVAYLINLPMMTAFWTVVVALSAIARMGRSRISLGTFPEDRLLGLRLVGDLGFRVFLLAVAVFGPLFAIGADNWYRLVVNFLFFAAVLGVMALAFWKLHRQMAEARAGYVQEARRRYAAAYRAAEADPGDSTSSARLSTTEALMRGAESIQEWPFDDRTQRISAAISTGVVTSLVVRAILLTMGV